MQVSIGRRFCREKRDEDSPNSTRYKLYVSIAQQIINEYNYAQRLGRQAGCDFQDVRVQIES